MKTLHLDQIEIRIGTRVLIPQTEITVGPGQVLAVVGPSGAGKSTLLAFVGGFLQPDFSASGRVFLNGADITNLPPERRSIGLLFQDDLLFPHLSVGQNLEFGLASAIRSRQERRARVQDALDNAGLDGFAGRDPATLSGGQKARVTLLRTLLASPKALLLDEPFSKLDPALRSEFRAFVYLHIRAANLPTILVTHDEADLDPTMDKLILRHQ